MKDAALALLAAASGGFAVYQFCVLCEFLAHAIRSHPLGEFADPELDQSGSGGGDPIAAIGAQQVGGDILHHDRSVNRC